MFHNRSLISNLRSSVKRNLGLFCFCLLTPLCDWSKTVTPSSQPIIWKTKISHDLLTRDFPRLRHSTTIYQKETMRDKSTLCLFLISSFILINRCECFTLFCVSMTQENILLYQHLVKWSEKDNMTLLALHHNVVNNIKNWMQKKGVLQMGNFLMVRTYDNL